MYVPSNYLITYVPSRYINTHVPSRYLATMHVPSMHITCMSSVSYHSPLGSDAAAMQPPEPQRPPPPEFHCGPDGRDHYALFLMNVGHDMAKGKIRRVFQHFGVAEGTSGSTD